MGYNDFHKGFRSPTKKTVVRPFSTKSRFGARSIEEIIRDKYKKRDLEEKETSLSTKQTHINNIDYQQNMHAQRNLKNLDK